MFSPKTYREDLLLLHLKKYQEDKALNDLLEWIQDWYLSNCNGDWEHFYGVKIDTLDNPGWMVTIHLNETILENAPFQKVNLERSEQDWVACRTESGEFKAACGPKNLSEVLTIFKNWAISISG